MNSMKNVGVGISNWRRRTILPIGRITVVALLVALIPTANLMAKSRGDERREQPVQVIQSHQSDSQRSVSATPATVPQAPNQGADHWSVMASGGGWSSLGSYRLGATLGQTVTGRVSLGGMQLLAGFWQNFASGPCCAGRVGDANGLGVYPDEVTLGDIMLMVDAVFISLNCDRILCLPEADINQSGGENPNCDDDITLGDIMILVDFLFIHPETATLPDCL